ncbi:pyruvoyl-dependent arginine decarboxylase [Nocardia sp. bgisy134]|uniref:pyruvoyl-dependent arginine decarboxylase n=1 Tax=Nocardia sp. bgisy134 TaxID=3413789 RepID=UPI003D73743C
MEIGAATGVSPTAMSAFDAALRELGVGDANLIRLSSVIPPRAVLERTARVRKPIAWGDRLSGVDAARHSYYAGFTLVVPSARQGAVFHAMIKSVVQILVAERAAVGWDICSYNNTQLSFADSIRAVLDEQTDVEVAVEDSQTHYAAQFTRDGATKGG